MSAIIVSLICRTIAFLSIIASSVLLTCYFNDPKYLFLLLLVILVEMFKYEPPIIPEMFEFTPYQENNDDDYPEDPEE